MDGIMLQINEDGTFEKYKEPYCSIECQTEEDFKKLEELIELGLNELRNESESVKDSMQEIQNIMTNFVEEMRVKYSVEEGSYEDIVLNEIMDIVMEHTTL